MITKPQAVFYDLPFATLKVTGSDAGRFLQGQLTCNIDELADNTASIAAFCNAKGRVISTLLIIKTETDYLVILPSSLADVVQKKLQMYILRSQVTIQVASDLQMIGLTTEQTPSEMLAAERTFPCEACDGLIFVKMPSDKQRFLCIGSAEALTTLPLQKIETASCEEWQYQDISNGIPWFDISQSEQYIPQMINIDKLGGISFSKGCYTGQEIVARTHYLGKSKRQMHLGECNSPSPVDSALPALNPETNEKCGDILVSQTLGHATRLLLVLQSVDDTSKSIILGDVDRTAIRLLPFE